jgi:hypothetical protein
MRAQLIDQSLCCSTVGPGREREEEATCPSHAYLSHRHYYKITLARTKLPETFAGVSVRACPALLRRRYESCCGIIESLLTDFFQV